MEALLAPDVLKVLLEVGGTPAALAFMLYYAWNNGPKKDLNRMADTVEDIRKDLNAHRDMVLHQQLEQQGRLQRLEIIAEALTNER